MKSGSSYGDQQRSQIFAYGVPDVVLRFPKPAWTRAMWFGSSTAAAWTRPGTKRDNIIHVMPTVLKLLYGVAAAIWLGLGYIVVKLFVPPLPADHNPHTMAAAYCLLLIGGLPLPTLVGYVLFFRVLPWIGRSLRRA